MFKVILNGYPTEYTTLKFSGGEIQVRLTDGEDISPNRSNSAYITAKLTDSDSIMELANLVDAFRRCDSHIFLHLVCPYLPYARQDRVCAPGESLALRVMCDLINNMKFESVEVWDVHSDVSLALLNASHNIGPERFLGKVIEDAYEAKRELVLVSPDAGAVKKVTKVAKEFDLPMVTAMKHRDPKTGEITGTEIHIPKELTDKEFLIVDDICDGGRTFIELAKAIRTAAPKVTAVGLYVTHGIFSKGLDVLTAAGIDYIYTANPFPAVDLANTALTVVEQE